jgi:hypothetical protein
MWKTWRRVLIAVSFSAVIGGCQSVRGGCPPLIKYTAEQQQRAAKELRGLGQSSQIAQMIVDYKKTRDACRVQ